MGAPSMYICTICSMYNSTDLDDVLNHITNEHKSLIKQMFVREEPAYD